jgi:anhydro-N-acetylmuramic acid kinase
MSGTSLDGIDAALVELRRRPRMRSTGARGFHDNPYTASSARDPRRHRARHGRGAVPAERRPRANGSRTRRSALCARTRASRRRVDLIGSHGQTVWHLPPPRGERGATLQLGCARDDRRAHRHRRVSDFRARDMAAGGRARRSCRGSTGCSSRTRDGDACCRTSAAWQPDAGCRRAAPTAPVLAFDTGPGNALIDAAVELATNGAQTYDECGARARAGPLTSHCWKSCSRTRSSTAIRRSRPGARYTDGPMCSSWRTDRSGERRGVERVHLDADGAVRALHRRGHKALGAAARRGRDHRHGGRRAQRRAGRADRRAAGCLPVSADARALGIDPAAKEAVAFATLAWAHVHRLPGNVPEATGAAGARVLGSFTPGRSHSVAPARTCRCSVR